MADILVIGGGFAGVWAALTAARELDLHDPRDGGGHRVTLLSRDPWMVIRPRLYEANPRDFRVPLAPTLDPAGVGLVEGTATSINPAARTVTAAVAGRPQQLAYDRLVIAAGSVLQDLPVPGLGDHGFDIDTWHGAVRLDEHLAQLDGAGDAAARTVVIIGAGFTGIELSTEMRGRLADHWGADAAATAQVVLVERAAEVGPDLGANPRPAIEAALAEARVEVRLVVSVTRVNADSATLSTGETLPCRTVVNTAGLRANPLAQTLGVPLDDLGRLPTDDLLRVPGADGVYATGDIARARVDDDGHVALMSCQHGMRMGKAAGYNVARDLLGLDPRPYRQERYVTCLDLGRDTAVFTTGWDREVELTGAAAKDRKRMINGQWIYPPTGTREEILAAADPDALPGR